MIDRKLCEATFGELPAWPCPTCGRGSLGSAKIRYGSGARVGAAIDEGWIEPWDNHGVFSAVLECQITSCAESVVVSGEFSSFPEHGTSGMTVGHSYTIKGILPAIPIIDCPALSPEPIVENLRRSFALFWPDPQACVATIRTAIERLVDHFSPPPKKYVPLDTRLRGLTNVSPELIAAAKLIKGLGNSGAHGSGIDRHKLLSAYELLEIELKLLFNDDQQRRSKLRAEISSSSP